MLFVKRCCWGQHARSVMLKAHVGFVVLTLNSLWSFLEDRSENEGKHDNGHGKMMNLTSSAAFALMAMSLSKLQLGFEVGVSNFLFGCFLVTLMKMSFKLAPLAAFFCYLLVNVRSISDFLLEMRTQHADDDTVEANFLPLEAISDVFEDEAGFQGLEPYSDVLGFRSSAIPFQTAWDLA
ncbi:hypothetical protein JHK87_040680 [Glycine soja]|nr:hypothetical protein JHK87_040680 [Glycine soja]